MSLSTEEVGEVERIAKHEVRDYFDRYLVEIFPVQIEKIMDSHNHDVRAHAGVQAKLSKLQIAAVTFIATGGAGVGAALTKILPLLAGAG